MSLTRIRHHRSARRRAQAIHVHARRQGRLSEAETEVRNREAVVVTIIGWAVGRLIPAGPRVCRRPR